MRYPSGRPRFEARVFTGERDVSKLPLYYVADTLSFDLQVTTYLSGMHVLSGFRLHALIWPCFRQWDMGVNNLVMCNFRKAKSCFEILATESSWSKAVYM